MEKKWIVVIPARLESTRLPRKLLLRETGMSVLQHTYEACCKAIFPENVWIATSDDEIIAEAGSFAANIIVTRPAACGTDRVAQAAQELPRCHGVVNVQADEPGINPDHIDRLIRMMDSTQCYDIGTIATPFRSCIELLQSSNVKVVTTNSGVALYFSRGVIPYGEASLANDPRINPVGNPFLRHVGIYAFRRHVLGFVIRDNKSQLEQVEGLEQLRWLQHGWRIGVLKVNKADPGVDTKEDYNAFVTRIGERLCERLSRHTTDG